MSKTLIGAKGSLAVVQASPIRSYEPIADALLKRIHDGDLRPGERLATERELAVQYQVSRGVIREALTVLGALGLVESRQGSGTYVTNTAMPSISRSLVLTARPDIESVAGLAEIRVPLEQLAARLAAERRTDEQSERISRVALESQRGFERDDWNYFGSHDISFHHAIGQAAHNPLLQSTILTLHDVMGSALSLVFDRTGRMEVAADFHVRIAAAIARQDVDGAGELMAAHIRYSAEELLAGLANVTGAEKSGENWSPLTVSRLLTRSRLHQLVQ